MEEIKIPMGLETVPHSHDLKDKICRMLESTQICAEFSRQEIEVISSHVNAYKADAGITVFREGQREGFLCFIIKGKVNILKDTGNGQTKQLSVVTSGKTIGEMSLLDGMAHSATALTAEPSVLILLSVQNLNLLAQERADVAYKLILKISRLLSLRLRQVSGKLVDYL